MKEIKQQKRKRKRRKRVRQVCLVLVLLGIVLMLIRCGMQEENLESEPKIVSLYEEQVNEIVEIDYTKQQEALNAIVEEGKMNVNYSSEAVFRGAISEKFNVKNIKNNHYPITFELYDEEGTCIYASKQIEPGYEISSIELQKKLVKGIHECKLKIGYAEAGNVSSVFPITVEVK